MSMAYRPATRLNEFYAAAEEAGLPCSFIPCIPPVSNAWRAGRPRRRRRVSAGDRVGGDALLTHGVLERFPRLGFFLSHGGGALPWILPRLSETCALDPALRDLFARDPREQRAKLILRFDPLRETRRCASSRRAWAHRRLSSAPTILLRSASEAFGVRRARARPVGGPSCRQCRVLVGRFRCFFHASRRQSMMSCCISSVLLAGSAAAAHSRAPRSSGSRRTRARSGPLGKIGAFYFYVVGSDDDAAFGLFDIGVSLQTPAERQGAAGNLRDRRWLSARRRIRLEYPLRIRLMHGARQAATVDWPYRNLTATRIR